LQNLTSSKLLGLRFISGKSCTGRALQKEKKIELKTEKSLIRIEKKLLFKLFQKY
jgi:hypothetical protein